MLTGFLAGTLALVVLQVVVRSGDKAQQGGNAVVAALKTLFEPGRAGIGNHAAPAGDAATNPSSGGGGTPPKFT
jgi:hypothetical protein